MAETVKHAAALATDLGADIVKLPLSGSVAEMRQIVESCPLPVVTAGGSQVSDAEFNQFIADVMKSGARGIAAGRNVFMAADPGAKVREVRRVLQANFGARPQLALARTARARGRLRRLITLAPNTAWETIVTTAWIDIRGCDSGKMADLVNAAVESQIDALEFRHSSWNTEGPWEMLKHYDIGAVMTDSPLADNLQFLSEVRITSENHTLIRFHGRD